MSSYSKSQASRILHGRLGFRGSDVQVVATFQAAYNLGAWLSIDGQVGPATSAALARSADRGMVSAHFAFDEFRCTCGGRFANCRRVLLSRNLLRKLEVYRGAVGPVRINSGYRCPGRNAQVGGATSSRHLRGEASDINGRLKLPAMRKFGFNGNGVQGSTGLIVHVDVRPTWVTPWRYAT